MYIHDMTEEAYKNGYEAGVKDFIAEFERRCIEGGIYPAFVKAQIHAVKKEMIGGYDDDNMQ